MEIQIKSNKLYRRLGIARRILLTLALFSFGLGLASAEGIKIGLLSFDVFIPASTTPPVQGINAFDIFNYTGPTFGGTLGPPFASESLTFENASLMVTPGSGSPQTFSFGNIGPGELLDANGNPVVQFPSTDNFVSATFTATLSPTTFKLSDGSTLVASGALSAELIPSSGSLLQANVDSVVIFATPVPEPGVLALLAPAIVGIFGVLVRRRRILQIW